MSGYAQMTTIRCTNAMCRIETYVGTLSAPLNACPVCQAIGFAQSPITHTATVITTPPTPDQPAQGASDDTTER